MQLTSFRLDDRVDLEDLLDVALITPGIEEKLPQDLQARLEELKRTREG